MNSTYLDISTELIQAITSDQACRYRIIPKMINGTTMEFYIDNAHSTSETEEELEVLFGKRIHLFEISSDDLQKNLSKYYKYNDTTANESVHGGVLSEDNFLEQIVHEAYKLGSSDIHIESSEKEGRVRLRVDGKLFERFLIKKSQYSSLINKIKILANLDIAEKRLPQDGRISYSIKAESFDIRVSIVPAMYGEKIVLRLLSRSASRINLDQVGFNQTQLSEYKNGLRKNQGIILVSGPTGSGKTTTLYATLNMLNQDEVNILTIEDPIEYTIKGINQIQLKENIGLTYAKALRSFLRQDPDIIMLGEIRDKETAQMAIRASLTGHLVLSTIHTNSAWGVVTRLLDMGIPGFLLASTLNTTIAQRLVRNLCPKCKKKVTSDIIGVDELLEKSSDKILYEPSGCLSCNHTGYRGRSAIFEVIRITPELENRIRSGMVDEESILKQADQTSLAKSALELLFSGKTSYEEVAPLIGEYLK